MSFILEALKKVDRKKDDAGDGVIMQGGRRWGETRFPWPWVTVVLVAFAALALATVALMRSFRGEETVSPAGSVEHAAGVEALPTSPPPMPTPPPEPDVRETTTAPPTRSSDRPGTLSAAQTEPTPAEESGEVAIEVDEIDAAPPVTLVGRTSDGPEMADVDQPADEPPPSDVPSLTLQGTSIIDGKPVAVVNYQRLFEGDVIEGARVVRILDRAVELEYNGTRFTIRL